MEDGVHPDGGRGLRVADLLVLALRYARQPAAAFQGGVRLIHSDGEEEAVQDISGDRAKIPWTKLLGYRQTWAFFWGKFLTDGVWWFYLFWLPDYFIKQFGMTTEEVRLPTFVVYGVAIVGSVYGGSLPMTFIRKGLPVYQARMRAMLLIASSHWSS